MRRQDAATRELALAGTLMPLPEEIRQDLSERLLVTSVLAHTPTFWQMDFGEFCDSMAKGNRGDFEKGGIAVDDEMLFNAFEAISLGLTRPVDTNPKVPKAAGLAALFPWSAAWRLFAIGLVVGVEAWRSGPRHTYCSARLQALDGGHRVNTFTVAKELGHGGDGLVRRIYGHLGQHRHRSEVVECRVEHFLNLAERVARFRLGTVSRTVVDWEASKSLRGL